MGKLGSKCNEEILGQTEIQTIGCATEQTQSSCETWDLGNDNEKGD